MIGCRLLQLLESLVTQQKPTSPLKGIAKSHLGDAASATELPQCKKFFHLWPWVTMALQHGPFCGPPYASTAPKCNHGLLPVFVMKNLPHKHLWYPKVSPQFGNLCSIVFLLDSSYGMVYKLNLCLAPLQIINTRKDQARMYRRRWKHYLVTWNVARSLDWRQPCNTILKTVVSGI